MTDDENRAAREAWDANAAHWDAFMGESGNAFVNTLIWPATVRLLALRPGETVLDIACGNGLYALRLAELGAQAVGFDFSAELIAHARRRAERFGEQVALHLIDATDGAALLALGEARFDAAICQMALFDMADIAPLAAVLPRLLRPGGRFVFSTMHPSFNGMHASQVAESYDNGRDLVTDYSMKITRYLTPFTAYGIALRDQPEPQPYFHRSLQDLLRPFLAAGLVIDGLEERAFPPDFQPDKGWWSGRYSEFPPVLMVRMRRVGEIGD